MDQWTARGGCGGCYYLGETGWRPRGPVLSVEVKAFTGEWLAAATDGRPAGRWRPHHDGPPPPSPMHALPYARCCRLQPRRERRARIFSCPAGQRCGTVVRARTVASVACPPRPPVARLVLSPPCGVRRCRNGADAGPPCLFTCRPVGVGIPARGASSHMGDWPRPRVLRWSQSRTRPPTGGWGYSCTGRCYSATRTTRSASTTTSRVRTRSRW